MNLKMNVVRPMLMLSMFCAIGCRDYLSEPEIGSLPSLITDKAIYGLSDTATVTLFNPSSEVIYVTVVYNAVEIKNNSEWFLYSTVACGGGCPETAVGKGQIISTKKHLASNPGIYRLVCSYGKKPNTPQEEKYKVYSAEFTVD